MHDNEAPKGSAVSGQTTSALSVVDNPDTQTDSDPAQVNDEQSTGAHQFAQAGEDEPDLTAAALDAMESRVHQLERQAKRLRYTVLAAVLLIAFLMVNQFNPAGVIVQQTLMESEEVKLVDNAGNTRLFLRMYSKVPVLQLLDSNSKPRMSLGLRFDDTPFIDLSDKTGRTRAIFEMTEEDAPTLKLFNEDGEVSFAIN